MPRLKLDWIGSPNQNVIKSSLKHDDDDAI